LKIKIFHQQVGNFFGLEVPVSLALKRKTEELNVVPVDIFGSLTFTTDLKKPSHLPFFFKHLQTMCYHK
jgi:hypothetical protein